MFTSKIVLKAFLIIATSVVVVNGSYEECQAQYGPAPAPVHVPVYTPVHVPVNNPPVYVPPACDSYPNKGSSAYLDNHAADDLNTEIDEETPEGTNQRLNGEMPKDDELNFEALYPPANDAFCFNEDYPVPFLDASQQINLYHDYVHEFNKLFEFTNDVSEENNRVTNNRIPGMFLRMCFHDNTIDPAQPKFQNYVASSIDPVTKKWIAESRYLKTSGADASNLICPDERFHPNNNYDQTASRVLRSIQNTLKKKYSHMSYADLLHNGCNAATIFLTGQTSPASSLAKNPFTFGRKDACHVDKKCFQRYPLCGPSELLPGVSLKAPQVTRWITSRGMSTCLFAALMWTHTTVDNMASLCPIKRLTCTASQTDVDAFTNKAKLYFQPGDNLDYFNFFLTRGTHQTLPDTGDDTDPSCNWIVNNRVVPWPMTGIDCTIGLSNLQRTGPVALANAIKNFAHNATYSRVDVLQCALKVLGGKGGSETGACRYVIPKECRSPRSSLFGGFYSTLPASATTTRTAVDPRCEKYGYRRRSLTVLSPEIVTTDHAECLDANYDMYLVIEGAHFAGLATPSANYTSSNYCPPFVFHSKSELNGPMEKLIVVAAYDDIEKMDKETRYYLGSRPLASIVNAFDAANVGLNGATTYNPITNNCVSMLRNMADPLDIPLKENEGLVQFITARLLSDSANHMFEIMEQSPTLKMLYDGSNRLLKAIGSGEGMNKEDVVAKLIKLYL
jgi:Peroxidase